MHTGWDNDGKDKAQAHASGPYEERRGTKARLPK